MTNIRYALVYNSKKWVNESGSVKSNYKAFSSCGLTETFNWHCIDLLEPKCTKINYLLCNWFESLLWNQLRSCTAKIKLGALQWRITTVLVKSAPIFCSLCVRCNPLLRMSRLWLTLKPLLVWTICVSSGQLAIVTSLTDLWLDIMFIAWSISKLILCSDQIQQVYNYCEKCE